MLLPYSGTRTREHFSTGRSPHTRSTYGRDLSERKTYAFNSLGFRGEEFRSDAARKLYVCGCSYTFGVGLDLEESWPYLFRGDYARRAGLDERDVCLMNFSQGGASNAYIVRTLISQAAAHKPDLLIAHLTYYRRCEYYLLLEGGDESTQYMGAAQIAPHMVARWWERRAQVKSMPAPSRSLGRMLIEWANRYYRHTFDDLRALAETIYLALLLQSFCRERGIDYLICWLNREALSPTLLDHPALGPMVQLLDRERLRFCHLADPKYFVDRAADDAHPGPRSNALFAEQLFAEALQTIAALERSGQQ